MKTTPIREQIYEFIEMYVDTPEPKKLCSSIEDLVDELAEIKVKNLALSGVSKPFYCERQANLLKQCSVECDYCKSIKDI